MDEMSQQSIDLRGRNISQRNLYIVVTASARTNLDSHYILDAYENGMMYRMTPLDGVRASSSSAAVDLNPPYRDPANPPNTTPMLPFPGTYMHQSPPHGGDMHQTAPGHWRNLPTMAFLQHDDLPSLNDYHSNFDTEDMLYEEDVLLVDELIVKGLLEEIIAREMKTTTYLLPTNLEGSTSDEEETDLCIICLDGYKNQEKIGILQCKHSYHADCLRRWLLEKNVCPMCKSIALILPDCFYVGTS